MEAARAWCVGRIPGLLVVAVVTALDWPRREMPQRASLEGRIERFSLSLSSPRCRMVCMNPRHAAALVLVGWYLMMRPIAVQPDPSPKMGRQLRRRTMMGIPNVQH